MARDQAAHRKLAELLSRVDLTGVPVDDLVAAIKAAMTEQQDRDEFVCKALAALNDSGLTFDKIGPMVGMTRSKANRLARKTR